jgi:hypothetical protein
MRQLHPEYCLPAGSSFDTQGSAEIIVSFRDIDAERFGSSRFSSDKASEGRSEESLESWFEGIQYYCHVIRSNDITTSEVS